MVDFMKETKETQDALFVRDKHIWRRFLKMLWKARLPYLWILGYILISMLITNIGVSATEYTSEMFAGNLSFTGVILPWLIYTLVSLITAGISTMLSYLCNARIDRSLRRMVWDKVTRLPMRYFSDNPPKELLTRITGDTSTISSLIIQVILPTFTGLYTLFITFRKVSTYDPMLMWSLLAVVPFVLVVAFLMGKLEFGINDTVNRKNAEMTKELSEKVTNMPLIKGYANEDREEESGGWRMKEVYRTNIRNSWITNLSSPVYTVVGTLQLIVIILIGRDFYSRGAITLAQWIAYLAFAQQIANTLQAYAGYWASFKAAQGATRRVTYIMDEENESSGGDRPADDLTGPIRFEDVTFGYGEEHVLDHFTLEIPEGKVTAVIGLSGSGKTTLLNLLMRFYEPGEGHITVGGEDVDAYQMRSYRENLVYVTQETTLLSGTVRDNILYGVKREVTQEELEEACRRANAYDFICAFPDGFDTQVGESGGNLSGGQRQRIAIARALLRDPHYLLLDEATAAMDISARDEVWKGMKELMDGKTTVMVAHDYQTVSHADWIVVMENGKISDAGTAEELAGRNSFYRHLAGLEVQG